VSPATATNSSVAPVEQQLQPEAFDTSGSSLRDSVPHMSVPFLDEGFMGAGVERL
jgi:hypothetical protein